MFEVALGVKLVKIECLRSFWASIKIECSRSFWRQNRVFEVLLDVKIVKIDSKTVVFSAKAAKNLVLCAWRSSGDGVDLVSCSYLCRYACARSLLLTRALVRAVRAALPTSSRAVQGGSAPNGCVIRGLICELGVLDFAAAHARTSAAAW